MVWENREKKKGEDGEVSFSCSTDSTGRQLGALNTAPNLEWTRATQPSFLFEHEKISGAWRTSSSDHDAIAAQSSIIAAQILDSQPIFYPASYSESSRPAGGKRERETGGASQPLG